MRSFALRLQFLALCFAGSIPCDGDQLNAQAAFRVQAQPLVTRSSAEFRTISVLSLLISLLSLLLLVVISLSLSLQCHVSVSLSQLTRGKASACGLGSNPLQI